MAKRKHIWHCGICHCDCKILKRNKGTKYIYCPNCDRIVAYYNPIPLIAAGLSYLAPKVIDVVGGALGGKKKKASESPEKQYIVSDSLDKPNRGERTINKVLYGE